MEALPESPNPSQRRPRCTLAPVREAAPHSARGARERLCSRRRGRLGAAPERLEASLGQPQHGPAGTGAVPGLGSTSMRDRAPMSPPHNPWTRTPCCRPVSHHPGALTGGEPGAGTRKAGRAWTRPPLLPPSRPGLPPPRAPPGTAGASPRPYLGAWPPVSSCPPGIAPRPTRGCAGAAAGRPSPPRSRARESRCCARCWSPGRRAAAAGTRSAGRIEPPWRCQAAPAAAPSPTRPPPRGTLSAPTAAPPSHPNRRLPESRRRRPPLPPAPCRVRAAPGRRPRLGGAPSPPAARTASPPPLGRRRAGGEGPGISPATAREEGAAGGGSGGGGERPPPAAAEAGGCQGGVWPQSPAPVSVCGAPGPSPPLRPPSPEALPLGQGPLGDEQPPVSPRPPAATLRGGSGGSRADPAEVLEGDGLVGVLVLENNL